MPYFLLLGLNPLTHTGPSCRFSIAVDLLNYCYLSFHSFGSWWTQPQWNAEHTGLLTAGGMFIMVEQCRWYFWLSHVQPSRSHSTITVELRSLSKQSSEGGGGYDLSTTGDAAESEPKSCANVHHAEKCWWFGVRHVEHAALSWLNWLNVTVGQRSSVFEGFSGYELGLPANQRQLFSHFCRNSTKHRTHVEPCY
jgi:hypothetical protein